MKKLLGVLAVAVMLSIFAPVYILGTSESFASQKVLHYKCEHCDKTIKSYEGTRAVKEKCPKSPNGKHHFVSCGRW